MLPLLDLYKISSQRNEQQPHKHCLPQSHAVNIVYFDLVDTGTSTRTLTNKHRHIGLANYALG